MSNPLHHEKFVVAISPAAILDNASATATEVDTAGFNYATFVVQLGATDIAMTALKVRETDTSGSGQADLSGADFDGGLDTDGNAVALPSASDDDQTCVFQISLDGVKRYLDLVATFGDGTSGGYVSAVCILSQRDGFIDADSDICDGGCVRV